MCFPVCGMMYIKDPLLLIGKFCIRGCSKFVAIEYKIKQYTIQWCFTFNVVYSTLKFMLRSEQFFQLFDLMNELKFNDTPARKTDRLLGVRKGKCMKWLYH